MVRFMLILALSACVPIDPNDKADVEHVTSVQNPSCIMFCMPSIDIMGGSDVKGTSTYSPTTTKTKTTTASSGG